VSESRGESAGPAAPGGVESENARTVREGYALWNEDRFDEALERFWDPHAVLYHPAGWPEPGPSVGLNAVAAQFARGRQDFDADRLEILELLDLENVVVVRARWFTRGSGSGVETTTDLSVLYWFENGLVARCAMYWDHDQALVEAGA
jgi:ketosteroid isomerase-like protein